jgi:hypothetical protein
MNMPRSFHRPWFDSITRMHFLLDTHHETSAYYAAGTLQGLAVRFLLLTCVATNQFQHSEQFLIDLSPYFCVYPQFSFFFADNVRAIENESNLYLSLKA